MRCPLAAQIGQKYQSFTSRWNLSCLAYKLVETLLARRLITVPLKTTCGTEHHSHQMPTASYRMTKRVQSSTRLNQRRLSCCKHDARSSECHRHRARPDNSNTNCLRRLVATSRDDWSPLTQTSQVSSFTGNFVCYLVSLKCWWQPLGGNVERIQYRWRPGTLAKIKKHCAGAVCFVHRERAGESITDVVFWKQNVPNALVDFRLVLLYPQDLWRSKSGQRIIARSLDQLVQRDARANLVTLGATSLIVPQDGGTKDLFLFIQQDESVHLTRQTDRCHVFATGIREGECLHDTVGRSIPPLSRFLFRPQWVGRGQAQRCRGATDHPTFRIDEQRFRAGG